MEIYQLPLILNALLYFDLINIAFLVACICIRSWERSDSVVECLTQVRRAAVSSLTCVTALWSLSKTHLS